MKQKVSLVLSGGGVRGSAHIGVIEELEKQGFEIVSIAGTSMGSVVGGIYALGKLEEFKTWLYRLDKLGVFKLLDFSFSSQGLVKGDRVIKEVKKFISDQRIEDLKISYVAVAVDLLNKKEVVFKKGSIYEAIRASISFPTVFTPVNKDNTLLIDGGVLNNIPINHVKRVPGDLLIAVNVNANIPFNGPVLLNKDDERKQAIYRTKINEFQKHLQKFFPAAKHDNLGYFNLINKTISLMTTRISQSIIEKYPPDILISISKESCGTFDFYRAEEMVEAGRNAAQKILQEYKERLIDKVLIQ
jgi:NTE family protein